MNRSIIPILIVSIFALGACKDDCPKPETSSFSDEEKLLNFTFWGDQFRNSNTLIYDEEGVLDLIQSEYSGSVNFRYEDERVKILSKDGRTYIYSYEDDLATLPNRISFYSSGTTFFYEIEYDEQGRITKYVFDNDDDSNPTLSTVNLAYDNVGALTYVKVKRTHAGGIVYQEYESSSIVCDNVQNPFIENQEVYIHNLLQGLELIMGTRNVVEVKYTDGSQLIRELKYDDRGRFKGYVDVVNRGNSNPNSSMELFYD